MLLARCGRLEGHFLGDPLVRLTSAVGELTAQVRPLLGELRAQPGAPAAARVAALTGISRRAVTVVVERPRSHDPLRRTARHLATGVATELARQARDEVEQAVRLVLGRVAPHA